MQKEIKLNKSEENLLRVLNTFSCEKGYMFLDQLSEVVIMLCVFPNQNTFNKTIFRMRADGILQTTLYRKGFKIVSLTHRGGQLIGLKMKKKANVSPLTLELITKRVYCISQIIESRQDIKNYENFLIFLNFIFTTFLITPGPSSCIDYYNKLKIKEEIKQDHIQYLNNVWQNLTNNLKKQTDKNIKLYEKRTILNLIKKNIYIAISYTHKTVHYRKILIGGVKYDRKKILDEILYLDKFHRSVFQDYKYKFVICGSSDEDCRFIVEQLDRIIDNSVGYLSWENNTKVIAIKKVYKYFA